MKGLSIEEKHSNDFILKVNRVYRHYHLRIFKWRKEGETLEVFTEEALLKNHTFSAANLFHDGSGDNSVCQLIK